MTFQLLSHVAPVEGREQDIYRIAPLDSLLPKVFQDLLQPSRSKLFHQVETAWKGCAS